LIIDWLAVGQRLFPKLSKMSGEALHIRIGVPLVVVDDHQLIEHHEARLSGGHDEDLRLVAMRTPVLAVGQRLTCCLPLGWSAGLA